MTETSVIETAIDTLVALKLTSLSDAQAEYTQLLALNTLIAAVTDGDINGYDVATARAALINAYDIIAALCTLKTTEWTRKFQGG